MKKPANVAVGINGVEYKDILRIWIWKNDGDKFLLNVCNELKTVGWMIYGFVIIVPNTSILFFPTSGKRSHGSTHHDQSRCRKKCN